MIKKYKGLYKKKDFFVDDEVDIIKFLNIIFEKFHVPLKLTEKYKDYFLIPYKETSDKQQIPYTVVSEELFEEIINVFKEIEENDFEDFDNYFFFKKVIFNELNGYIIRRINSNPFSDFIYNFYYVYGIFLDKTFSRKEEFFIFTYNYKSFLIKKENRVENESFF